MKFFKVDKARTREYGGSGIGLSIVKAIMDSFQQQCGCQNYDNGVAFWFTLEADGKRKKYDCKKRARKRKYSLFLVRFSCIKEKDGVE